VLSAGVVVPTHGRPEYLRVALASLAAQGAGVVVVLDGPDAASAAVAREGGARVVELPDAPGLNAARNAGIDACECELVCFVDDDVEVRPGWLGALRAAASELDDVDVFTGPIHARLEDHAFRACGREGPPITAVDLGERDVDAPHAWGANMAIRRTAFDRLGRFDERQRLGSGDEVEWQDRVRRSERPRIRYVAGAALDHRRAGDDARLRALTRAAHRRGIASRRFDVARGDAPALEAELRTLAGSLAHGPRFACMNGPVLAAHSAGRLRAAVAPGPHPGAPDYLAGRSGTVGGRRAKLRAAADRLLDVLDAPARARVARLARRRPPRRSVLVLAIVRPHNAATWDAAERELRASRHTMEIVAAPPGELGKFENLRALLERHPADGHDWLLVVDDDVALPRGFLDGVIALAERFDLRLVQPAHRLASHGAWPVTRRRPLSLARETAFVEIGPVTAIRRDAFDALLPFPPLRMGWGLDVHWAALARERGWRIGVVDVLPIAHLAAPAASAYSREQAEAEAARFLDGRPYLPRAEADVTLRTHRRV
jgi:GT2 family glycosyltransferase